MDNMGIVDDGCLDSYDMAKAAGSSAGGRVHSIDVILGFAKDQEPLLHSMGNDDGQKTKSVENPSQPEKQVVSDPYVHIQELGDSSQKSSYSGEPCYCDKCTVELQYIRWSAWKYHCLTQFANQSPLIKQPFDVHLSVTWLWEYCIATTYS